MKILIVDDHPIVRAGLRRLLAGEPDYEVQEAASGREALAAFREYQPDLVMLDLSMPGIGGLEVIGAAEDRKPGGAHPGAEHAPEAIYATRALQAGAAGFMSKNAPADRLLEAVEAGRRRTSTISSTRSPRNSRWQISARRAPRCTILSPREFEILRLLGDGSSLQPDRRRDRRQLQDRSQYLRPYQSQARAPRTADLVRIAIQHGIAQG